MLQFSFPSHLPILLSHIYALSGLALATLTVVFLVRRALAARGSDVHRIRQPPGGDLIFGHEKEGWETPDSKWYIQNVEKMGLVFAIKAAFGHPDIIVTADPGALHHIYGTSAYNYGKSTVVRPRSLRMLGKTVAWANGDEHRRQRQIIAPIFTHPRVRLADESVNIPVERWVQVLQSKLPANGQLEMARWLSTVALDVIGRVAFSFDFGCGETEEAQTILDCMELPVQAGMVTSGWASLLLIRAFPWMSAFQKQMNLTARQSAVRSITRDKISKKLVETRVKIGEETGDILQTLIRTTNMEDPDAAEVMIDNANAIVIGGHETMAKQLALIVWQIAQRPDVQKAMREEFSNFKGAGPGGRPTYDDYLNKLPFLDATIKEGLRRWPIGSLVERVAEVDDVVPLRHPITDKYGNLMTSIRIRKGQTFYIPGMAVNTARRLWGDDGLEFDPYRWLKPGRMPPLSELTGGINGHYTFTEGPRVCAGYRLATFELKVIISSLVRHFELSFVDGVEIDTVVSVMAQTYVVGKREEGAKLPLILKPVDL